MTPQYLALDSITQKGFSSMVDNKHDYIKH